jgi:hypothetical protein
MRNIYLAFLLAVLAGCSDAGRTQETLEKSGYHDIHVGGYAPFSCGQDDSFSTGFHAVNAAGQPVDGVVCCGVLKGCTVRF